MTAIKITSENKKYVKEIPIEIAKNLLQSSRSRDFYIVYDETLEQPWMNQEWCEHNILGFYLGKDCTAYTVASVKEALLNLHR